MEKFIINPKDYRSKYIQHLNECFNGWGGIKEYKWGLERIVGDKETDIVLIENEEDGVIAGSAVSYRKLSKEVDVIDIGIMTGTWTLPAARRKGCFKKMIKVSKDLCRKKDVDFLTAFVTETNPSSKGMESVGSFMLPTFHLFSPEFYFEDEDVMKPKTTTHNDDVYQNIFDAVQKKQSGFLNFSYDFPEFVKQYIRRIKETIILVIDNDFAILEEGTNEMKILLLTSSNTSSFKKNIMAVSNWCLKNKSRKAFFFTTRKEFAKACLELDFENVPGYFTSLTVTDKDVVGLEEIFGDININMADKM